MFAWLHFYQPQPILLEFLGIKIYWYGLLVSLAVLVCLIIILKLTKNKKEVQSHLGNLFFYLLIFGLIGARFYDVLFYNFRYFLKYPWEIIMVWHPGLAIHGAIIAGIITIFVYCKKNNLLIWPYLDIFALVLPMGQAIGRIGNYFNQELFGLPCNFKWCIPIEPFNRPADYQDFFYFQPVFLYESLLNLLLFIILFVLSKSKKMTAGTITASYLIGYSIIRFFMEFLRLDVVQTSGGLKWVQWLCLAIIAIVLGYGKWIYPKKALPKSQL